MFFGILSISDLIQIAFLVVTLLGAILIVKQLREARLASQMEALMELDEKNKEVLEAFFVLSTFMEKETWSNLSTQEKAKRLEANEDTKRAWRTIASYCELIALSIPSKSLSSKLAYDFDGDLVVNAYRTLEPAIEYRGNIVGPSLFNHFE